MSELLPCVEIEPRSGEARGAVLWLHGLGANGHDFEPIVPYLDQPELRFVFPHAPQRPVTINSGLIMPAWYDIRYLGAGGAWEPHIRESRSQIEALLAREKERGVAAERIVLAGFSQGAGMALYCGIRHAESLAGIMVLSGYELLPEGRAAEETEANRKTPILFCHGTYDPLLPVDLGQAAYRSFETAGRAVEWHEFPIGHEVSMPEIQVIASWLAARFG